MTASGTTFVLMTVHNRRELTLRAVTSLAASAARSSVPLHFVIHDDGSTDGTADALAGLDHRITVVVGDGSAFWAKGMASAEARALRDQPDHLLWLNDDVEVDENAFEQVLLGRRRGGRILVGATRDPDTGVMTYSGFRMRNRHPLGVQQVEPGTEEQEVATFNGNFVDVPVEVALRLGGIDGTFAHSMADIDYGFRASAAGVPVVLLPGTIGACRSNPDLPGDRPLREQLRAFVGVKGAGHPRSLIRLLQRHAPRSWWFYFPATYGMWAARRIRLRRRRGSVVA